jgi:sodium-dependent dicarboxylate transporter 2/3/5
MQFINKINIKLCFAITIFLLILMSPQPNEISVNAWRVAAVGSLMAILWATEAIPLFVTALLPLIFFPLFGISSFSEAALPFSNKNIFLFLGGFILALSIQKSNLHERIALGILRFSGKDGSTLIAGFMAVSAFLSMWMMNTSTTLMLLPIGISVAKIATKQDSSTDNDGFATALMLGIAYAATIGGMTTLIGTAPNAVFASFIEENYNIKISFLDWLRVGLPLALIMLPATWFILTKVVFTTTFSSNDKALSLIKKRYQNLGKITVPEKRVLIIFCLTAFSWISREGLQNIPGLHNLSDHVIAIIASVSLFLIPNGKENEKLMDWETAKNVPWNLLILFGGGLSLANAVSYSGLSVWLGGSLEPLGSFGIIILVVASVGLIIFLTELTSNLATTSVFLPVIASMAIGLGESPLVLTASITLAASCAFMLPVATPPNLIVYGSNLFKVNQMMKAGFVLNILGLILVSIIALTLVPYFLG